MTIDEAIEKEREEADLARGNIIKSNNLDGYESWINSQCIKCVEEHEQLAEWLEELKAYIEIGTVEECRNSVLDIKKAYNKAIDDFVEKIKLKYLGVHPDELHTPHYAYDIVEDVKNISEQLKAGGENEMCK